jgi:[glutamine synthetase] adenylyltransferase / [glutamine synthetase]-adenylyl-L-tyrosine phosphorylase
MKPALEDIQQAYPSLESSLLREHWERLDERYFLSFDLAEIAKHVEALSKVSPAHPVELLFRSQAEGVTECTVLAFDYPFEFAMITGVLAATGFSIRSGDVFTYRIAATSQAAELRGHKPRRPSVTDANLRRRRIVDRFVGHISIPGVTFESWKIDFTNRIRQVFSLLEQQNPAALTEAKQLVNKMVAARLENLSMDLDPALYPVSMQMDNESGAATKLKVVSRDTPAFLYSFSHALSLQKLAIERVTINTIESRVEDDIEFVGIDGRKIRDVQILNQAKLSVLLTKQFTYFLSKAPDQYAALERFERLVLDVSALPEQGRWMDLLTNPRVLRDLARLLGTSDFIWEDFIRLQYESLLPMLDPVAEGRTFVEPPETIPARLKQILVGADTLEEAGRRINEFKDREIFLIDLDHILGPASDFRLLAERLTLLAEAVLDQTASLVYRILKNRYGTPRSAQETETSYAVLGLGKLGGADLGYASDIEVLFVYASAGETDGTLPISNAEFFEELVKQTSLLIRTKSESIFRIDLRLRPYGASGPLACSLESFSRYYAPGGPSHSFERLALVRLRAVGGDREFGRAVERLRDELVYADDVIDLSDLRELRRKQLREKVEPGQLNAKFSPGALVDLEYDVQIFQLRYGRLNPALRTPRVHEALDALTRAGVLTDEEGERLSAAYGFLRRLINGLRMLRGSALDLVLPLLDSDEFRHLARRMGYERAAGLDPERQLRLDFDTHTAAIRAFIAWEFEDELPASAPNMAGSPLHGAGLARNAATANETRRAFERPSPRERFGVGNVADLILSDHVSPAQRDRILRDYGFKNPDQAFLNIQSLVGKHGRRVTFAKLAVLACDILRRQSDPDRALNNWARFILSHQSVTERYDMLFYEPSRLEIILSIFSSSQFLADTIDRYPGFLNWVTVSEHLHRTRTRAEIESELRVLSGGLWDDGKWADELRTFRRREILRIGTRDMCMGVSTREIMAELSALAEAIIQIAVERIWARYRMEKELLWLVDYPAHRFCVMAFGKLGGQELNYSSDVDLLGIADPSSSAVQKNRPGRFQDEVFATVMKKLRGVLSDYSEYGYAYRVDLRLRPYGSQGQLVQPMSELVSYYRNYASLWEIQALLKARPVAGNLEVGFQLLEQIRPLLLKRFKAADIVETVDRLRQTAIKARMNDGSMAIDVKTGSGGIRDIEFLVQGLQLIHASSYPQLLNGNTLSALDALKEVGILSEAVVAQLGDDYIFLRKIEHYLQILEDRQIHALPSKPDELDALAKRVLGFGSTAHQFMKELTDRQDRVRASYQTYLIGAKDASGSSV